jgi:outer membrane protein OmpA-like peptidoglycan-associated protein
VKNTRRYLFTIAGLAISCAACGASAPSKELLTARDAYAKVSTSSAAEENPEGTREAQTALAAAEASHLDDAGSDQERSAAYVATRKSELAAARAEESRLRLDREKAEQAYQAQLAKQLTSTQAQLAASQEQLETLRADAEKANNERVGWRKKGENLVITLSGVSFDTGGHTLTSDAKKRLDVVAHALKEYPERNTTIAGYTDNAGREEANLALSQKRADSVKAYLISQGVPSIRLASEGRGESNPVASNDTPQGKASNRRVEITLLPKGEPSDRQLVKGVDSAAADPKKPK